MLLRVYAVLPLVLFVLGLQFHGLSAKENDEHTLRAPWRGVPWSCAQRNGG